MSRFSSLIDRLRRLEPAPVEPSPWPPAPGSFGYLLWQALGKPEARCGYMEMYLQNAENFYEEQK